MAIGPLSDPPLHRFGKIGFVFYPEARENIVRTPSSAWLQMDKGYGKGAEINHVTENVAKMKADERLRYVAYRRRVSSLGCGLAYRLRMLVTNHPAPDEQCASDADLEKAGLKGFLVASNNRCGRSEHANGEIKSDFAGGMRPSGSFGSNNC